MLLQGFLIGFTLLIHGFGGVAHAESGTTISEHVGKTVELPCPVNMTVCGALHSINWFKGENRIAAVLLDDSNITSVSEGYKDRVIVEQSPFKLIIKDLQISDEDMYLCDTTFFIPLEACDNYNGYRVKLNVLVPPTEVVIKDEKGDRIENGTVLGPLQEGHTLRATCIVNNTRPQPSVGWFGGKRRLTTHSPTYDEKDGLYTATLELSLVLTRQDLGNAIECRVESSAIQGTIRSVMNVDMQVRPTGITLSGVEHHTVQGSKVVLTCQVYGARPAVNISWSNSSKSIVDEDNALTQIRTQSVEQKDGTYHTVSDLIFNASRFENDMVFRCDADNVVLRMNREKPVYSFVTLEVMYPPVVKVSPPHITVNTSDTVLLNCEYVANPASLTSVKWYRNTDLVNVNDTDRYEGGNAENVALVIKSTDKRDIGNYSCHLSNSITTGKGVSETQIELDVQYVPIVEVLMTPEGPVKESDESNVTLYCNVVDANPSQLTKVRWYANSSLLKELPDCTETNEDLCHIDPSKLLLESIGRGFFYNYSCEGFNAAGWGPRSEDKELMVHYEPGPATLTYFPIIAQKKKSVTFSCSVDDPGYPETTRFRWFRGGRGPMQDDSRKDWILEPVGLDSRTNYSCYAYNEGGHGQAATVNLEVHAPPFFIKNLFPYTGILYSSRNASLMCRIECVPRCTISWYKDGIALGPDNERYFVKEEYMAASPATGDFESVMSVLHFNMTAWPNKRFDINSDSANYSCVSSSNEAGAGIKSATYFSIEYAPENTTVTDEVVHVLEGNIPGRVVCKSKANPEPSYEWRFNNKTVTRGSTLIINNPMSRNDSGRYTCVAFNKHGSSVSDTFIDVQFKPKCEIERREIYDKDTLICTAFGNPVEADFSWSIKAENDSVETLGNGKINKDKSFYILDEDYAIARTYRCVANNSVGAGTFCEVEVAEKLAWYQRWDKTTLIILVAAILGLLLAVIIICCIIICICRRRRRQDKYHTEVSISATQSVLSYQPTSPLPSSTASQTPLEIPKSPPRWPLRPGVMVHVKNDTKQNLAANRLALHSSISNTSGASTIPRSFHSNATIAKATMADIVESKPNNINNNCTSLSNTISNIIRTQSTLSMTSSPPLSHHQQHQRHHHSSSAHHQSQINTSLGVGSCPRSNHSILRGGTQSLGRPAKPPKTVRVNPNNTILTDETPRPVPPPLPPRNPRLLKNSVNSSNFLTNISAATSANELLPKPNGGDDDCPQGSPSDDEESRPIQTEANTETTTAAKIIRGSGFFDRLAAPRALLGDIFKRRRKDADDDDRTRDSQRSHVGLLSSMLNGPKAFWKHKDDANPFSAEHRLKGIRCSGSVTYKKTPTLTRSSGASETAPPDANAVATITSVSISAQPKTQTMANEIHDKSSSLGDPLTEPGEYENLPFHGLQTAPNKFTTTPTNFNNNANVVRVAPRPKRLTSNHDTNNQLHQQQQQLTHHQYHSNIQNHHQQQSYNTIEYNRTCNPSLNNTIKSTRSSAAILDSNSLGIPPPPPDHQFHHSGATGTGGGGVVPQQLTYSLNNCFPKSYTEYYHQQQQQKFSTSNSQLLNSIEHNYPYTVVERGPATTATTMTVTGTGNAVVINNNGNNPFLAGAVATGDFKKFDTSIGGGGSMHRTKRSKGHSNNSGSNLILANGGMPDGEKKFYSLKFPGNKKSHHHLNSIKPAMAGGGFGVPTTATSTTTATGNKCKRHHSFAGAGAVAGDVVDVTSGNGPTYATPMQSKMRFYEPPVYENLNDSIQIHECQVDTHQVPSVAAITQQKDRPAAANPQLHHKKRHHQHHLHQKKVDDFNLIEPERLSIYRSDSGISNSSYECVTPVPAPRIGAGATIIATAAAAGKSPGNRNANPKSLSHTNPVYMNVDGSAVGRSTSPFESPSSQNDPSADPASVSSCQSLYSASTAATTTTNRCGRHPVSGLVGSGSSHQEVTTPEDGSSSTTTTTTTVTGGGGGKCKRRTPSSCSASLQSLERAPNTTTNPFLATNHSTSSSSGCASSSGGSTSTSNHSQSSRIHRTASSTSAAPPIKSSLSSNNNNNTGTKQQMLKSSCNSPNPNQNHHNHDQQQLSNKITEPNSSSGSATDGEVSSEDPASHYHQHHSQASITATTDMTSNRKTNGSSVLTEALNNSSHPHHMQQQQQQSLQTSKKHPGYTTRPVRLPLRKHHSFHFQPSQTVAGIRSKHRLKHSNAAASATCNGSQQQQQGMRSAATLFLNENSAFKPISPVEHISSGGAATAAAVSSRLVSHELIQQNFDEITAKSTTDGRSIPRICGTSLKRHLSNVETYDSSRYNNKQQHYNHQRRMKHRRSTDDEDDDEDEDDRDVDYDEELDSDDEDSVPLSTSVPNQVVYADVQKNTLGHHRDDLVISSDSEMIQQRSHQFHRRDKDTSDYPNCRRDFSRNGTRTNSCRSINADPDFSFYDEGVDSASIAADVTLFSSPARQRTTQYISARNFNEVKI